MGPLGFNVLLPNGHHRRQDFAQRLLHSSPPQQQTNASSNMEKSTKVTSKSTKVTPKSTTSLRELLERLPENINDRAASITPTALQLEKCDSEEAREALIRAQDRFLQSAMSFFKPCFQDAVLENLARDDPLVPPNIDNYVPYQAEEQVLRRRSMDEMMERVRTDYREHLASTKRINRQLSDLREQLRELSRTTEEVTDAGIPVLDKTIDASEEDGSSDSERECEETLREQTEMISAVKARRVELAAEVSVLRERLVLEREEVLALEQEQAAAAVEVTTEDAKRKAKTSRDMEKMIGVADMTDAQLNEAVRAEEALVRRNRDICGWYKATVSNLQLLTGITVSHRLLFGGAASGGGVQGLELMIDLGSGQILQVAVSAIDGKICSTEFCPSPAADEKTAGRITASDLAELKSNADALPSPENLRMFVREALGRVEGAAMRSEHVQLIRRSYLVEYREATREVIITMPVGIVVSLRLHPDYPKVAGGAKVITIAGVGGWSRSETDELCRKVNSLALATLMETMDGLEEAVAALDG